MTRAVDFMKPRVDSIFFVTDNRLMLLLSIYLIIVDIKHTINPTEILDKKQDLKKY